MKNKRMQIIIIAIGIVLSIWGICTMHQSNPVYDWAHNVCLKNSHRYGVVVDCRCFAKCVTQPDEHQAIDTMLHPSIEVCGEYCRK